MILASKQDVLKALGLDEIKNLMSVDICIDGSSSLVKATLVVAIEKPKQANFIDLMNSGISHFQLIKVLSNVAD